MEKIKQKPIETVKTVIISLLVVTMLVLASLYIGGAQFATSNAAINAGNMPVGTVPVGNDIPSLASVYDKELLAVSFIGIRFGGEGGGAYGSEQAARDLVKFAAEPLHYLLSSSSLVKAADEKQFDEALWGERYICLSLVSPLPYQIIYALTGEYVAPFGSDAAISPQTLLITFDAQGKATLYMYCADGVYVSEGDYVLRPSELSAMASDSRLHAFDVTDGIMLCESSPLVQTVSVSKVGITDISELNSILSLFDYNEIEDISGQNNYSLVAPHGTLSAGFGSIAYFAASESGIPLSNFLDSAKSDLDIDMYDVLLSSVSLVESIRAAAPSAMGDSLGVYLDGFYRKDDIYTVIFGFCESNIPVSGDGLPYFAKITAQGGRLRELDLNLAAAERSGYTYSPFSSAWEYRYASKNATISTLGLRYNIVSLPCDGLGAAWYYTGERTVAE